MNPKPTTLKSLEKRVAALEEQLSQLLGRSEKPMQFKDWRLVVGTVKRTDLAEEIDAAGRKIREADRRKARS